MSHKEVPASEVPVISRDLAAAIDQEFQINPQLQALLVIPLTEARAETTGILRGRNAAGLLTFQEVFGLLDKLPSVQYDLVRFAENLVEDLAKSYAEKAQQLVELDREIAARQLRKDSLTGG